MSHTNKPFLATIPAGPLNANCYLFGCPEDRMVVIIDPGGDPKKIVDYIERNNLTPLRIINTHGHADHTGGNRSLKEYYGIPVTIHKDDADFITSPFNKDLAVMYGEEPPEYADETIEGGETIPICEHYSLKAIHTPGHSMGGICLLSENILFSGDTLFASSIGRSDLQGGSFEQLITSIKEQLITLPDEVKIFPGHGPSSTIGKEKSSNPFL